MKYQSVAEAAIRWGVAERTVRNYCASGKIPNAVLVGKTWSIPESAQIPERANKRETEQQIVVEVRVVHAPGE